MVKSLHTSHSRQVVSSLGWTDLHVAVMSWFEALHSSHYGLFCHCSLAGHSSLAKASLKIHFRWPERPEVGEPLVRSHSMTRCHGSWL